MLVGVWPDTFLPFVEGKEASMYGAFHLVGLSNTCINPFLYGYLNENFRKEYKNVYR